MGNLHIFCEEKGRGGALGDGGNSMARGAEVMGHLQRTATHKKSRGRKCQLSQTSLKSGIMGRAGQGKKAENSLKHSLDARGGITSGGDVICVTQYQTERGD